MPVQDDEREEKMVSLFNLKQSEDRKRHQTDAWLDLAESGAVDYNGETCIEFELKSTTTRSVSTVRDFGKSHIEKWACLHWIVGFFPDKNARNPRECKYLSPEDMKAWTNKMWQYIKPDFDMAALAASRLTVEDMQSICGKKNRYLLADAKNVMKKQIKRREYLWRMDIPGGYSLEALSKAVSQMVVNDIKKLLGEKDIYSEDDLVSIQRYQNEPDRVRGWADLGKKYSANRVREIAAEAIDSLLLDALLQHSQDFPYVVVKKVTRQLCSKTERRRLMDWEPGYSVGAMLEISRARCKYM